MWPSAPVLWQLGERLHPSGRRPGIAQTFLRAMREVGLLGEPVWTTEGAQLYYQVEAREEVGVPVTVNGTWMNLVRAADPTLPAEMGAVPVELRDVAKARVATMAAQGFGGATLTTAEQGKRVVLRTERGSLFGYVQRGHEARVRQVREWRVAWAVAEDGNVHAVLHAVG